MSNENTALTLEGMPTEILEHVFSFMPIQEIRRIRLVSKKFDAVAARTTLRLLVFYTHAPDFDRFDEWQADYTRRSVYHLEQADPKMANKYKAGLGPGDLLGVPSYYSKNQLDEDYANFKHLATQHQETLRNNVDYEAIAEVLGKFSKLLKVTLGPGGEDRWPRCAPVEPDFGRYPFTGRYLAFCAKQCLAQEKRALDVLSRGLMVSGFPLQHLKLGLLSLELLSPFCATAAGALSSCLTHLEVDMELDYPCKQGPKGRRPGGDRLEYLDQLREFKKGQFREFAKSLRCLRTLSIKFSNAHLIPRGSYSAATLHDTIEPRHRWPALQCLTLEFVQCKSADLLQFVTIHEDTLKSVYLEDVRMDNTEWTDLIAGLRALNVSRILERGIDPIRPYVCGKEWTWSEFWKEYLKDNAYGKNGDAESWNLGPISDENPLTEKFSLYLSGLSDECPNLPAYPSWSKENEGEESQEDE
ncbi:hypothetical protein B0T22DRAFT_520554 [Podospora appendiculata]|uniref:F-box domain-containing protein n=1 Tax=Podospora appendiculata TaxID=314037 RepID=A0AAE0X3G1_9PEZI|nr:hypothetical protein B0T22DRAFT_520554 [Podospora appendiculata]